MNYVCACVYKIRIPTLLQCYILVKYVRWSEGRGGAAEIIQMVSANVCSSRSGMIFEKSFFFYVKNYYVFDTVVLSVYEQNNAISSVYVPQRLSRDIIAVDIPGNRNKHDIRHHQS